MTVHENVSLQAQGAPLRASLLVRIALLFAVIGTGLLGRFDTAVAYANSTDWLPERFEKLRAEFFDARVPTDGTAVPSFDANYCNFAFCPRLDTLWFIAYLVLSALVTVSFIAALAVLLRANATAETRASSTTVEEIAEESKATPLAVVLFVITAIGVATLGLRAWSLFGQSWASEIPAIVGTANNVLLLLQVAMFLLGLLIVTRIVGNADVETEPLWMTARRVGGRHRPTLLIVGLYAASVTLLPIMAEQTADALRLISLDPNDPTGVTSLLFLLLTTILFSVVVLKSWRLLDLRAENIASKSVPTAFWGISALVVLGIGLVVWIAELASAGIAILGGILLVLWLLSLRSQPTADGVGLASQTDVQRATPPEHSRTLAARVAAVPLVALAAALFSANFDLTVVAYSPSANAQGLSVAAIFLAVIAVAITREVKEQQGILPMWVTDQLWLFMGAMIVTVGLVLAVAFHAPDVVVNLCAGLVLVALSVYLVAATGSTSTERDEATSNRLRRDVTIIAGLLAGAMAFVVVHVNDEPGPSRLIGTVAFINVFCASLVAVGYYLSTVVSQFSPPVRLKFLGVRTMPILSILLVWWVIAGLALPSLHDVRVVDREVSTPAATLGSTFATWVAAQPEFGAEASEQEPHTVPLVIVGSHGGGIRAAYWTALIMDCLVARSHVCDGARSSDEQTADAASRIFIASGVSGGGVGLAAYSMELREGGLDKGWVDDRLRHDLLAPVVGRGLFHDLPNHLIGTTLLGGDRAATLEKQLEGPNDGDSSLRSTWDERSSDDPEVAAIANTVPLVIINSSTTTSPHRALASAANLSPWPNQGDDYDAARGTLPSAGTADVVDVLCRTDDVRLSTAAVLGARFPIISPSGTLDICAVDDNHENCYGGCALQMVDGGYIDNSGMTMISTLMPELQQLIDDHNTLHPLFPIAPIVVDINNDYLDADVAVLPPGESGETIVPLSVRLSGASAMEATGTEAVKQAVPCYIPLSPQRNLGLTAPLGWALSDASRESLIGGIPFTASLPADDPQAFNSTPDIATLQNWLNGGPPSGVQWVVPSLDGCLVE